MESTYMPFIKMHSNVCGFILRVEHLVKRKYFLIEIKGENTLLNHYLYRKKKILTMKCILIFMYYTFF